MSSFESQPQSERLNEWVILGVAVGAAVGIAFAAYASCEEETNWDRAKKTLRTGVDSARETLRSRVESARGGIRSGVHRARESVADAGESVADQVRTIENILRLVKAGAAFWMRARKVLS